MAEYDLVLVEYDRKLDMELNCKEADSKAMVAFKDLKCVGFGTIKTSCHKQRQFGPLYADDATIVEVMLKRLKVSLPKAKGLALLTISTNSPANDFMETLGCRTREEYTRSYRKKKLEVDINKVLAQYDLNFCPH
ncbi:hypothetical protein AVEN_249179-1 [Araneus ventricosus]|uniref:YitH/HolE acetyltransferase (GNAT) domain-containing protein n=1 Tax=Araneus ventricosus TaxID=182803 RepID=A0A4Y2VX90_ARAVE|nr:hypothetical protein AVEN_249179-1 [Araneus ventricosus]